MAASDRFKFIQRNLTGPGSPIFYMVVEASGHGNTTVGRVIYDVIMQRWAFILDEVRYAHIDGVALDSGSADAQSIKDFINSLVIQQNVVSNTY